MPKMLWEYIRATARHYVLLLAGALGVILLLISLAFPTTTRVAGIVLIVVGVFGAQFLAWRDMRQERDHLLDQQVHELQTTTDLGHLGLCLAEATNLGWTLKNAALRKKAAALETEIAKARGTEVSPEALVEATSKADIDPHDALQDWEHSVHESLRGEQRFADAALFMSDAGITPPVPGSDFEFAPRHGDVWVRLQLRMIRLQEIIVRRQNALGSRSR